MNSQSQLLNNKRRKTIVRKPRSMLRKGRPSLGESKRSGYHPAVSGPRTVIIPLAVTPDRTVCQLRYFEPSFSTGALTGGTMSVYKFRINSTYDPYVGVGGGQPSGLAQMFAKYEFCRVWKSRIHVRIARAEQDSDQPYDIALVPITYAGSVSPPTTFATYAEQPYAVIRKGNSVQADRTHSLIQTISVAGLSGCTPMEFGGNGGFYHANGANPIYDTQWHIVLLQPIVGVDNTTLQLSVEIVYDCEFFMRLGTPANFMDEAVSAHMKKLGSDDGKESKDIAKDEVVVVVPEVPERSSVSTSTISTASLRVKLPVTPARSTTKGLLTLDERALPLKR